MRVIVPQSFFSRSSLEVARDLLGKFLIRKIGKKEIALQITEVEAYDGPNDLACHASKGRTPRCEALFGEPGHFYVYFVYGMHYMLNIVTDKADYPSGVLIRAAGEHVGPARLTKALQVKKDFYGMPAIPETGLWFEDWGKVVLSKDILRTPRIGVEYAGKEWANKPYRFVLKNPVEKKKKPKEAKRISK